MKKISIFLIFLSHLSCSEKPDCLKSTGTNINIQRIITEFETINLSDNINLVLKNTSSDTITVSAGSNLISKIRTEVKDRTLYINNENKCNWIRDYEIPVTVTIGIPLKSTLFFLGYGKVTTDDTVKISAIDIHHYGAGEMDLKIKSDYLYISTDYLGDLKIQGSIEKADCNTYKFGRLDLRNLLVKNMSITSNGEADSYIYCYGNLDGTIKGKGNIYYLGNPEINMVRFGEGNFIKIGDN